MYILLGVALEIYRTSKEFYQYLYMWIDVHFFLEKKISSKSPHFNGFRVFRVFSDLSIIFVKDTASTNFTSRYRSRYNSKSQHFWKQIRSSKKIPKICISSLLYTKMDSSK